MQKKIVILQRFFVHGGNYASYLELYMALFDGLEHDR